MNSSLDQQEMGVLGLQALLLKTPAMQALSATEASRRADEMVAPLTKFAANYRDGRYQLMRETKIATTMVPSIIATVLQPDATEDTGYDWESLDVLEHDLVRKRLVYESAGGETFHQLMLSYYPFAEPLDYRSLGIDQLSPLISQALDGQKLLSALDQSIGTAMAGIAHFNIVMAWLCYYNACLHGNQDWMRRYRNLAELMEYVIPLGRANDQSPLICLCA